MEADCTARQFGFVAIEDQFVPHGSVEDLMHQQQMDSASVTERILRWKEEQQKSTEQLPE